MNLVWRVLAAVALMATAACALPVGDDDDRPVVLTTFTVTADIARAVAGDHLRVVSITDPGAEIHGYEPTASDVVDAAKADLILDNGLNLEAWFAQFVADAEADHVVVSRDARPIPIAARAGTEPAADAPPNPHAWMSPLDAMGYVDVIAEAFAELDSEHADDYAANAESYKTEIQAVHDDLLAAVATVPESQRALVTCEGAFSYLARDAGLEEFYIWPVNSERQATGQQIADAIEFVRERSVPAVFCESTVSDDAMREVVAATDAVFGGTLYVDSLSKPDGPVPTYLDLLRHDVDTIVTGLTGGAA
ncbi:MAG: metal ABC transporter substrate-binding protein [Aeromicrobium sp.]|uniref:metal ABC transporter substrate-binding protein n=1 Tax=Aeromicrobium sp. TaxID=1871063 RepID=UPI0039E59D33